MGDNMKTKPQNLQAVTVVDGYKDIASYHVAALTASKTLEELLDAISAGTTVSENAAGVRIITTGGNVNYNPVGAATTTNALLPADYVALGGKSILDQMGLSAAAPATVELIFFGINE